MQCPKCMIGSGNEAGHRGRHLKKSKQNDSKSTPKAAAAIIAKHETSTKESKQVSKKRSKKLSNKKAPVSSEPRTECNKCLEGSGNAAGHRGRHLTKVAQEKAPVSSEPRTACNKCIEGSGNLTGHRGRHLEVKKAPEKEKAPEGPCPKCASGSDNLAGHRGRHLIQAVGKKRSAVTTTSTTTTKTKKAKAL